MLYTDRLKTLLLLALKFRMTMGDRPKTEISSFDNSILKPES